MAEPKIGQTTWAIADGSGANPALTPAQEAAAQAATTGDTTMVGNLIMGGNNIVGDPALPTQIGTGATQLLAFWGATPVVQPANASASGVSGIAAGASYAQADLVAIKAALTAIVAALTAAGIAANTA